MPKYGLGYGRIIWFIRVPRNDVHLMVRYGFASNLCRPFLFILMPLRTMTLLFMFMTRHAFKKNSTLNLKSQDPTNNKFFFMFWYIKNLGYVFYFFDSEFAIMLPFPSTLWLSLPIIVMVFLWDDLFRKIRMPLLFITC